MSREALAKQVELMSDKERDDFYEAIFKAMPVVEAEPWEIEAIKEGRRDFEENGGTRHEDINWK